MSVINPSLWLSYGHADAECSPVVRRFDEPIGCYVLEVGGNDNALARIMALSGFRVTSVDLKAYTLESYVPECPERHKHLVADFCSLPADVTCDWQGAFDVVVSVSALEHFGLGTYLGSGAYQLDDVTAARLIYDFLNPGGRAYLVLPVGGRYLQISKHWRVYDYASLLDRIVQRFEIVAIEFMLAEAVADYNRAYHPLPDVKSGTPLSWQQVMQNQNGFPGMVAYLKLRKPVKSGEVKR